MNTEVRYAIRRALTIDMGPAEAEFRSSLPDVPAREAMVRETSLEYRRLVALRALGAEAQPAPESLLCRMLTIRKPERAPSRALESGSVDYISLFGHRPTYPWTTEIQRLCHAGPQPSTGGDTSDQ